VTEESIVFDRAVEYYDRTRALPPEAQAAVTALLVEQLEGPAPVLELGVGTGRMALPLMPYGVDLIGIDLSEPMLHKLLENAGGALPFPLARADGLALPLRDGSLAAAFLCHVLHLIPRWQDAVGELVRVVRPGGLLLVDTGGAPTPIGKAVGSEFNRHAGIDKPWRGVTDPQPLDDLMASLGAEVRLLDTIRRSVEYTINEQLDRLAGNQFSSTWALTDDVRVAAAEATRVWAAGQYGDLDAVRREEMTIQWRAYRLPSAGRPPAA
jgi:ubiquinone/menaquinone biosynthesis C-methylase UbiE